MKQRAFNLIEMMTAMAIAGLILVLSMPHLQNGALGMSLRLAATEVSGVLSAARMYAQQKNVNVAVAFDVHDDQVTWTLYRDGNHNGVRRAEIQRGIDLPVGGPRNLAHFGRRIRFGFPPGKIREIGNPERLMDRSEDPIRFNQSDMASFSAIGSATPGTVYLTDGISRLSAVRVTNKSGKIVIWEYLNDLQQWRRTS